MNLSTAKRYAEKTVAWLAPHCERIEIAGSVRRDMSVCNDLDLVCIPKTEIQKDMLGVVVAEHNLLWAFLNDYVGSGAATFQTGGSQPGKFAILKLRKCQLDVYFATPETFATRMLQRTGSKEHNIFLAERAITQGMKWEPYEGLSRDGRLTRCETEAEIYGLLGLAFIAPRNRSQQWIKQNLEFGI